MNRLAIIRDGVVENVIIPPALGAGWAPPLGSEAVECPPEVAPGWSFSAGVWMAPDNHEQDPMPRVWTALEFDSRVESVSPGAWERLEEAAYSDSTPAPYRGMLRSALRQSSKAQEIVSDDPRTVAFLDAAVSLGVISEAERVRIVSE